MVYLGINQKHKDHEQSTVFHSDHSINRMGVRGFRIFTRLSNSYIISACHYSYFIQTYWRARSIDK